MSYFNKYDDGVNTAALRIDSASEVSTDPAIRFSEREPLNISNMAGKNPRPKPPASSSSSGRASKRPRREAPVPEDQKPVSETAPPAVTDDRFSSLHWDPRFSRVPKATRVLPVDDRFKAALVENPAFRRGTAPVDRFGRTKEREGDALLKGLYDLESEDEDGSEDGSEGEVKDAGGSDDESESESGDEAQIEVYDSEAEEEESREVIPRGQATKRLAVMGLDWTNARAVDLFVSLQSFCPPGKILRMVAVHPSKFGLERLAEESRLGPSVLQPADRAVVEIMEGGEGQGEAEVHESRVEDHVAGKGGEKSVSEDGSGDGDSESSDSDDDGRPFVDSAVDVESRKQVEQQKMRKYEEDRLKYYFAVAEFEDTKSADAVYEQCDGVEFEKTGLSFDLRFIPDDMVIETPVRDSASSIPDNYAPPNLAPSTLNNCKVKLSWDADAPDRAILKKRTVGKREEEEENLKAYLASSSESEGEGRNEDGGGEEKVQELARKRLLLLGDPDEVEEEVDDKEMEMEITFEPGLQEKGEDIMRRKEVRSTTVEESEWEARLRRMKERKAEKREARKKDIAKKYGKQTSSGDEDATPANGDGDGMYGDVMDNPRFANDPFFSNALSDDEDAPEAPAKKKDKKESKKSAKAKKAKEAAEQAEVGSLDCEDAAERSRRDANLELVMMRDDRGKDGNNLRDRLVDEDSEDEDAKKKKKKGRSRGRRRSDREAAALAAASETPKTALDTADDRFASLYSSHMFAMDPTHPKFKRNETTEQILKEKKRRGGSSAESAAAASGASGAPSKKSGKVAETTEAKDDIMSLAANIKAKSSKKAGKKKLPGKVNK